MRTLTDDMREIDEALTHAHASLRSFEAQGQPHCASLIRRKIDTLLDLRLMLHPDETP